MWLPVGNSGVIWEKLHNSLDQYSGIKKIALDNVVKNATVNSVYNMIVYMY